MRIHPPKVGDTLTPRELQVYELLIGGIPRAALAFRLHISLDTVKRHIQRVYDKVGTHSAIELAIRHWRDGFRPVVR